MGHDNSVSTPLTDEDFNPSKKTNYALDEPELDRIDRSIVVGAWLKQVALWALRVLIIAITGYVLWVLGGRFWGGILPIVLALIVCTVLAPVTTWLRRRGLPDTLSAIVTVLVGFGLLGGIIALIAPDIVRQSQILYLQILEGVQRLQLWAQGPPLNLDAEDLDQVINDIASWLQNQADSIAGTVFSGISTATSTIITLFMVLVLVIFFLKDGHKFLPAVRNILGRRGGWHATEVLTRAWTVLGGYIRAQAIVSFVDAFFIGLGLWLLDVPMAFTIGVITFIAGFIPYVGAITAGALGVIVALVSQGLTTAILALILIIAVQQLEGNILSPLLQSRAMNLHPVIVLISVAVGGGLFGILGAFLAVPAAAMIAVALRYVIDITTLQTGEKTADDIHFVTPEGYATGRINEDMGRELRQKWREDGEYFARAEEVYGDPVDHSKEAAATAASAAGDSGSDEASDDDHSGQKATPRRNGRLRSARTAIEQLISDRFGK